MDKAVPAQLPYIAASRVEAEPQLLVNVSNGTGEGLSACIPRRLSMKFTHHVIHAARVLGLAAEPSTMLFDEPAQVGLRLKLDYLGLADGARVRRAHVVIHHCANGSIGHTALIACQIVLRPQIGRHSCRARVCKYA